MGEVFELACQRAVELLSMPALYKGEDFVQVGSGGEGEGTEGREEGEREEEFVLCVGVGCGCATQHVVWVHRWEC